MRVSSIQFSIREDESKSQRLARMDKMVEACCGSQLVVLPEIWGTGYFNFSRYKEESEPLNGETVSLLADKARKLHAHIMTGSFVEKDGDNYYNTSVLLNPRGEVLTTYRKIHLFGFGSDETKILTPGDRVATVSTEHGILGLATCYDLRFPEQFRKMLDQGVEIILIASAWPFPRLDHWRILNQARALENECYLISANCAGVNQGKQYLGYSGIVNPWGVIITGAGEEEAIISAEISNDEVKKVRSVFPPVNDRVVL